MHRMYPAKHMYVIVRYANKHPLPPSAPQSQKSTYTAKPPLYIAVRQISKSLLLSVIYDSN